MRDVSITTPRLSLARLAPADAEALFAYRAEPSVCRYQTFEPRSLDDARAFITETLVDHPVWYQLGIRLRDGGRLVGDVGIRFTSDEPRQAEVGVTVAPSHQGQGIAAEALGGTLRHLFEREGVHRVFASIDPGNGASMRLFERLGMRKEAHFRQSLRFKGEWADDVVFAMLASEWEQAGRV